MKDFIKFTLASCLGVTLAFFAIGFIGVMMIAAIAASAGGSKSGKALNSDSVLTLDFSTDYPERKNNVETTSFSFSEKDVPGLHDIAGMIRHAAKDDKIKGIYIENGMNALGNSSSALILDALQEFKATDKFIAAYGDFYTQPGYLMASVADHITLHPVGTIDFRGFASYIPYFKGLIDKIGLDVQVYYAGDFKSATEPFRRTEMSPENRLQTKEFLDDVYGLYLQEVADSRGLPVDTLKSIAWNFGIKEANNALTKRLVDEVGTKADCEAWMNQQMGKDVLKKIETVTAEEYYLAYPGKSVNSDAKDKIAVVFAEGDIVSDQEGYGVIEDARYVKLLKEIREDESIKAVVLRINSPGGSILSAENIYQQLVGLKADGKKLVVSMGDYAASGGYYLSAMADSIFAQPNTLTGSIGVFSLIPNPSRTLKDKLGITFDTVRTGPYSSDFTTYFQWTERENKYMQDRVDAYYEMFLEKVSSGRNMTRDQVHAVAQGRIWSGRKALELGLVDRLGDLDDAMQAASTLAGIKDYRVKEYPIFQNPLQKMLTDFMENKSVSVNVEADALKGIQPVVEVWEVMQKQEPMARLPFGFGPN